MKFELVGKTAQLRSNGVDYVEGDVIEGLSEQQALEFKGILIPIDDEARSLFFDTTEPEMRGMRDHVKIGMLEERKKKLQEELKRVDGQLLGLTSKQQTKK